VTMVTTVVFDVGETLLDETALWETVAEWIGVPSFTLAAAVGILIERGEDHEHVFDLVGPTTPRDGRYTYEARREHFYPDAIPCLRELRSRGLRVGVAGNSSRQIEQALRALDLPVDFLTSGASLGAQKPDPVFFAALAQSVGCDPAEMCYVGDRIDNDVLPALAAGMRAALVRRGPWALVQAARSWTAEPTIVVDRLDELPAAIAALASASGS